MTCITDCGKSRYRSMRFVHVFLLIPNQVLPPLLGSEPRLYQRKLMGYYSSSCGRSGQLLGGFARTRWTVLLVKTLTNGVCVRCARLFCGDRRPEENNRRGSSVALIEQLHRLAGFVVSGTMAAFLNLYLLNFPDTLPACDH
jgi:hypothetical protein